jgi:hypothetical protein
VQAVAECDRVDPAAAVDQPLLDDAPFGGDEHLLLAQRSHRGHPHLDVVVGEGLVGAEAERDLVGERNFDGGRG